MRAADCHRLFERLTQAIPHPRTELNYQTAFELLVAVVLSAQSTDKSVNRATARLFALANTPTAMLALGEDAIKAQIKTLGLFNHKARHLIGLCQALLERHNGQVPDNRTDLQALPGVGRKTANVVLNTAFGQPTIAVDTHIFRVANRTGLAPGKTVRAVEQGLESIVPTVYQQDCHHLLILHGRYTCTARAPKCSSCPIQDLCVWQNTPAPI